MNEITPPLPGLSPVNGKTLTARFDGGSLSSDAGLLALREVERRLDVAGRLAAWIDDLRDPSRTLHSAADILRYRMLMIAAGYEDGIDAQPCFSSARPRRAIAPQRAVSALTSRPRRAYPDCGRVVVKGRVAAGSAKSP
ncbi:MAG: hypothetical protein CVT71_00890 [Alphaproteobacteria bacterium HGW-Alphaproteobacteria-10]|jgi:hypothetical protein|nr:MAG: hypothetical protein CVT71_00890 [Alphaproteobacteria bacterium HGW-Alphaproteobacteria-10]